MVRSQSTLNEKAAVELFAQMTRSAWNSLQRSLQVNRMSCPFEYEQNGKYALNRIDHTYNLDQEARTDGADTTLFLDCRKRDESIIKIADLKEKSRAISQQESTKLNLLIRRIDTEERGAGLSDELESFMFA